MLSKSEGSYSSALTDISNGIYDRAVSSLYYSAFQIVTALMLQSGVVSKSHTQTRSYVNRNLVQTGLISVELGKMYNRLMDFRADADYSDTVHFTEIQVKSLQNEVQEFNKKIRSLIYENSLNES